MTGILWAALAFLGGLFLAALGDMASEEIRDRLDHLPHAIVRLAALHLTPSQRVTVYEEEWLPELTYILKGAETRPITRLITGTWYALGILASAGRISHRLDRPPTEQTSSLVDPAKHKKSDLANIYLNEMLTNMLTKRNNLVHRDLKPENVFFDGNRGQVVLIDYSEVKLTTKKTAEGSLGISNAAKCGLLSLPLTDLARSLAGRKISSERNTSGSWYSSRPA